ncbi:hypothetical protein H4S06_004839 [Coemansia sp. BCRC 34490]|nr:hypothetical protein LPJ72_004150 [Coemansia sp. Benny D160-2]KAJ2506400.1 hypothetical protein GGI11_006683 [Coemansia sp. RSA 2049]KAJ2748794.1 hypothetical protein H4S06_004839 [Coemansia sp. BCRC 34490]
MMSKSVKAYMWRHWYRYELIPIYAICVGGVGICAYFGGRALKGPDVVWNKKTNPYPWLHVQQNQNTKLLDPNNRFEQAWSRDRL